MAGDEQDIQGSLPSDLFERGVPAFVDLLRAVTDADVLADFAGLWYDDKRPASRRLMLDYLGRPLNAFRHEGLIKRLFKRAETEGDDEVMARFLVLFDRSIRRVRRTRTTYMHEVVTTKAESMTLQALWNGLGFVWISEWGREGNYHIHAQRPDEVIVPPRRSTMPRGRMVEVERWGPHRKETLPDWAILLKLNWNSKHNKADIREFPAVLEKLKGLRLFSIATRHYLRRRAWRYFRNLGKDHPERYVSAASEALALYRDDDVADGLALIDNWGLIHILFHHCPAIEAKANGWTTKPGRSLAELAPAPIFESLWDASPGSVVGLLSRAQSRTVRRWAIRRIEADPASHRPALSLEGWIDLLGHDDPEVATLAADVLDKTEGLEALSVERWLALAESTHPVALDVVCELIGRHVRPDQVTFDRAVRLAGLRPLPVAKLGLSWLKATPRLDRADIPTALTLVDAECESLRPEILRWLRSVLTTSPDVEAGTILDVLDSRHADVRAEGWAWFLAEPKARDDVETWRRLLESPHDDVRLALVAELESRLTGDDPARVARSLDPEDLRRLWAAVLLNVHRGHRAKPAVVRQLLRRLEASPGDAPALLPLLGVALRSVRGPEHRAGLVAVVRLIEARPEVEPLVRSAFPELQWA